MSEKKERIVFDVAYQPQVRTDRDTQRVMLDVMIALCPAVVIGAVNFGLHSLLVILTSMSAAVFFEWAYRKLLKKSPTIDDLTAALTGLLLALVLPPQCAWWMPVIGSFFAIVVVKQLYGGLGKNFLNPALAGRAFLMASYAGTMGMVVVDGVTMATPLSFLYSGEPLPYTAGQMFLGSIPGCIGEVSTLALLAGGLYLIVRKVISWRIPVAFLGTVALLTLLGGHAGYSNGAWMLNNLLSGGLMLGAFFMATDYVTSPVTKKGQLIFGLGCGLITVFIRYFGSYPEGVCYSILIMNCCTWIIDKYTKPTRFGVDKKAKKEAAK